MASAVNPVAPVGISIEYGDDLVQSLRRLTVQIFGQAGRHGAGVVWRDDGLVVTNAHVLNGASMIRLHDGRTCHAALVARDRRIDLGILRIPISGLGAPLVRDSGSLRVGEIVMAVGHPMGEAGAVSIGIVHAASRGHLIEADIRLLPGNSGGPLADVSGRVVGINSMVANGMGVAISTAAIEQFLEERLTHLEGTG